MKILLVAHVYPPAVDGGSKVIAKIGEYLQSQGNQILVLTTNCRSTDDFVNPSSKPIYGHQPNVLALPVYKHLRRPLKLINLFLKSDLLAVLQKGPIFRLFPLIKSLITIKKYQPDLIIAGPLPTAIVLYASFITKITHAELLINASFHPTDPDFSRQPLIKTLQSADFIWTLTDFETSYFHQHFNIPLSKMINLGNGIDKKLLSVLPSSREVARRAGGFELLFIGSFAAHKGLETLIDAFSEICHLTSDKLTLTLAGQKTLYFPTINKKIISLPAEIKSRIKLLFNFSDKSKTNLLDSCTILISPSTQESFGLVLLEAWARSKPVIAADIPASAELITKASGGLIFKINDPIDLALKITKLLKSTSLQKQLGSNGYKYVQERATWDRIGQALWSKISSS